MRIFAICANFATSKSDGVALCESSEDGEFQRISVKFEANAGDKNIVRFEMKVSSANVIRLDRAGAVWSLEGGGTFQKVTPEGLIKAPTTTGIRVATKTKCSYILIIQRQTI